MIHRKPQSLVLYLVGIVLLLFGQRSFWEKYKETRKQVALQEKQQQEEAMISNRPFEIQEVAYDSTRGVWKNDHVYFQTIHVGNVNFKSLKNRGTTTVEHHDDENASDSF
ncbi:hypothetical protein [Myroides sp. DF42-4-2]|uniref:hypothetical protein n=1 Tax=unclassified Myroides TaxID=2642485 RepID=UPI002576B7FE|nr:hypothetical protein [Myroides sp. DF42-4-2]MDM1406754.1 hypothetical protein [Myroides sp. DF42-4-2]